MNLRLINLWLPEQWKYWRESCLEKIQLIYNWNPIAILWFSDHELSEYLINFFKQIYTWSQGRKKSKKILF